MPSIATSPYAASSPARVKNGAFCVGPRPMTGLLDELRIRPIEHVRVESCRTARVWTPLAEPASAGFGPSVAALTIGRPPRAPRPGQG